MSSQPLLRGRGPSRRDRMLGIGFVAVMAFSGLIMGLRLVRPGHVDAAGPDQTILAPSAVAMAQPLPSRPVPMGLDTPAAQAVADQARSPVQHPAPSRPAPPPVQVAVEEAPPTALSAADAASNVDAVEPVAPLPGEALITSPDTVHLR